MKCIINANILDFDGLKSDCYILYDKEISKIGEMKDIGADAIYKQLNSGDIIDAAGFLVTPGLVLAHGHIYSAFARGLSVPFSPKSFTDILEMLWWKLDNVLDSEAVYYSGLMSGVEFIKNGVTTVIDHHASGGSILGTLNTLKKSICDESKLRGIFCFETSDRFDVDACIEENLEFAKTSSDRHAGLFGMHASMTLSDNTLSKIASSIGDMPVHIHVAESKDDLDNCITQHKMRVVERLDKFGLIREDSILAHCVHINASEAQIISKRKAYVALNPTSNMNNAVGLPDYKLLKDANIDVLLGNDGLGYNFSREMLNMFFSMKLRQNDTLGFGFDDFAKIIDNNYSYVGKMLGISVGRIKEGFKADMLLCDYKSPTPFDSSNSLGHYIFGVLDNFRPDTVICDGQTLMTKGKITVLDADYVFSKCTEISRKVWYKI